MTAISSGASVGFRSKSTATASPYHIRIPCCHCKIFVDFYQNILYNHQKEMTAMQYENVQYENVEKLNRQGLWFVVIHTLILFNFVIDFEFFM